MSREQENTIILYDIPSTLPGSAWSPNTWKARFTLNYKKLPYRTEWVEYPDIPELCKRIGAAHTNVNVFGHEKLYTLPVIYDPSTKRVVAESFAIARYLDEQYPNTPKVVDVDGGLGVLQSAFVGSFGSTALASVWQFVLPKANTFLNPESEAYYRRTREEYLFKKKFEDTVPRKENGDWDREWKKVEEGYGNVNAWFANGGREGQVFVTGDTPVFVDFAIGGHVRWIKQMFGEDSREWKDISSWHGGRWGRIAEGLEKYAAVP